MDVQVEGEEVASSSAHDIIPAGKDASDYRGDSAAAPGPTHDGILTSAPITGSTSNGDAGEGEYSGQSTASDGLQSLPEAKAHSSQEPHMHPAAAGDMHDPSHDNAQTQSLSVKAPMKEYSDTQQTAAKLQSLGSIASDQGHEPLPNYEAPVEHPASQGPGNTDTDYQDSANSLGTKSASVGNGNVELSSSSMNKPPECELPGQAMEPRNIQPDECTSISYDYDDAEGHQILRLKPTIAQWDDFPAVLAYARSLGAESDGCFKVIIPDGLHDPLPDKQEQHVPANAYKVKQIKRTTFWQVSTVPSEGIFASDEPGVGFVDTVDAALKNLKQLFRKNQNRQMRNVRYRVDVPAWTKNQRRQAGVPERSPIYPLRGDKLDHTKAIIPGIHTPYVYESGPSFGATFQIHAEDFRLASLNHLYKGRKIWIVIPATAVDVAEQALGRGSGCSQFMRHRAEFFFPDKLEKLGIPYRIVDQRPGETIVILPDAYHEGFSTGYTIAEAKNYADPNWTTDSYQPCEESCKLVTAIPAAFMRPVEEGEERLDLCAAYGDGLHLVAVPEPTNKRSHEETIEPQDSTLAMDSVLNNERDMKRIKA